MSVIAYYISVPAPSTNNSLLVPDTENFDILRVPSPIKGPISFVDAIVLVPVA